MIRAVLFDFDGVVVLSEPLHMKTFLELLSPYGVKVTEDRWYREFAGTGSSHIFEILVRENNIHENVPELVEKRRQLYEKYVREGALKEMPGVRRFLKILREHRIKTAVVSGSHRTNVELALSILDLGGFFDVVISGDDIKVRKPDPGPFLFGADRLGLKPQECVVFEDSRSGMLAAKAAKMPLICVQSHPAIDVSICSNKISDFRKIELRDILNLSP